MSENNKDIPSPQNSGGKMTPEEQAQYEAGLAKTMNSSQTEEISKPTKTSKARK